MFNIHEADDRLNSLELSKLGSRVRDLRFLTIFLWDSGAYISTVTCLLGLGCPILTIMGLDTGFAKNDEMTLSFVDRGCGYPYQSRYGLFSAATEKGLPQQGSTYLVSQEYVLGGGWIMNALCSSTSNL